MRVCPSVGWSLTRFFQTAEFKPKRDLTSINTPAQRLQLLAGCRPWCLLQKDFVIANIEIKEKLFKGPENVFCYRRISLTVGSVWVEFDRCKVWQSKIEECQKKSYFVRNLSLDSVYILLAHESYLRYNIQLHKRILLFVETCAIKWIKNYMLFSRYESMVFTMKTKCSIMELRKQSNLW